MENIYVEYNPSIKRQDKEYLIELGDKKVKYVGDSLTYFEYLDMINNDFKRMRYIVNDFSDSVEKYRFLRTINHLLNSIYYSKKLKPDDMPLAIAINDEYVIFNCYDFDDKGKDLYNSPSVVVMDRDWKNFCFITETHDVFYDEEDEDDYNRGYQEFEWFSMDKNKITMSMEDKEEYSIDIQTEVFGYPKKYIKMQ